MILFIVFELKKNNFIRYHDIMFIINFNPANYFFWKLDLRVVKMETIDKYLHRNMQIIH